MIIKNLGLQAYQPILQQMQQFTADRNDQTEDQIWVVEHPPVFTLGRHADKRHLLAERDSRLSHCEPEDDSLRGIAIVKTDRGGQVTYHGPGQLVIYLLIDLKRLHSGPKALVCAIEKATIHWLKDFGIKANTIEKQPGIYVNNNKIASLGLRIKNGRSYHGISLNVNMDLTPFEWINPCGIEQLKMTNLSAETDLKEQSDLSTLAPLWIDHFKALFP